VSYDPEYKKAYHAKHKERVNAEGRERYRREKERRLLKEKERYQRDKEKILARLGRPNRDRPKLDPVKLKARQRRKNRAKKARQRNAFVEHVEGYIVFELDEGICGICSDPILEDFHVDHIIPLSRGGEHSYANVQAAHPRCNIKKGNKIEGGPEGRALRSQLTLRVI